MTNPVAAHNESAELARRGLILIHPDDNCYVVTRDVRPGDVIEVDGEVWAVTVALSPGHKVSRRPIAEGEVVTKFGVPIGVASTAIGKFDHVHLHNVKSQYIPTHERGELPLTTSEGQP